MGQNHLTSGLSLRWLTSGGAHYMWCPGLFWVTGRVQKSWMWHGKPEVMPCSSYIISYISDFPKSGEGHPSIFIGVHIAIGIPFMTVNIPRIPYYDPGTCDDRWSGMVRGSTLKLYLIKILGSSVRLRIVTVLNCKEYDQPTSCF